MKARLTVIAHRDQLIVALPGDVVRELQLRAGDEVDLVEVHRAAQEPVEQRQSLVALRKYRGRLPVGFKFDREDAHRR